jgi:hypothetical protein
MVPITGLQRRRRFEKPGKSGDGPEKGLANQYSRKKITKEAHAGHGQETKWQNPGLKVGSFDT